MEIIMDSEKINEYQEQIQVLEDKFKDDLERLQAHERESGYAALTAAEKYEADVKNKREIIDNRKNALKEQLNEVTSVIEGMAKEYAGAIQNGDKNKEKELNEALDELGTKESMLKRKIDAFTGSVIRGDDELFMDALMAYREHLIAHNQAYTSHNTILVLLTRLQEIAERYIKVVSRDYKVNRKGRRLAELLLEREGVDINRNAAGGDTEEARIRFLDAFVMGEYDPAFTNTSASDMLFENSKNNLFHE
jgi:hypothetical protein